MTREEKKEKARLLAEQKAKELAEKVAAKASKKAEKLKEKLKKKGKDVVVALDNKVNEKIKSFQVRIYGCFYQDGRVQQQLRIPKSSAYCYIDYFTLCDFSTGTTKNMNWKNYEGVVNGYYGKPTIFGTTKADYAADDKDLDTNGAWRIYLGKNGIQFESFNGSKIQKFQFRQYLGYELTIVYE